MEDAAGGMPGPFPSNPKGSKARPLTPLDGSSAPDPEAGTMSPTGSDDTTGDFDVPPKKPWTEDKVLLEKSAHFEETAFV